MKNIIIMASFAGSGKDTVANKLIEDSSSLSKMSLGTGIHKLYDYFSSISSQHNKIRESLQKTGEGIRDIYGKDIWIKDFEYHKKKNNYSNVVVPDVRKLYEYAYFCIEHDYLPIYIHVDQQIAFKRVNQRDGEVDKKALNANLEHQMAFIEELPKVSIGENGLQKVSFEKPTPLNNIFVINNNYSLERLNRQIRDWEEFAWQ